MHTEANGPGSLAQAIIAAREHAGMSQRDLASAVGVVRGAVHKWEHGLALPRPGVLARIADATGADFDALADAFFRGAHNDSSAHPQESPDNRGGRDHKEPTAP